MQESEPPTSIEARLERFLTHKLKTHQGIEAYVEKIIREIQRVGVKAPTAEMIETILIAGMHQDLSRRLLARLPESRVTQLLCQAHVRVRQHRMFALRTGLAEWEQLPPPMDPQVDLALSALLEHDLAQDANARQDLEDLAACRLVLEGFA